MADEELRPCRRRFRRLVRPTKATTLALLAAAFATLPASDAAVLGITPLSAYPDATCNDASRAAYYFRPAPNASFTSMSTWVVFLESGSWCYSADTCSRRSKAQTSNRTLAPTLELQGLFAATDARLRDANLAYVPYCSSDAWVGARPGPIFNASEQNATGVAAFSGGFRGAAIVRAVVADLTAARGLGSGAAATVLFAGFSAGGRGAMFNCDAVGALLAGVQGLSFGCLFDSALWIDRPVFDPSELSAANRTALAFDLFNASATVAANSPACAAAYPASGGQGWKCVFGEYALPFVQTPRVFQNMYLYDSYQLDSIAGIGSGPPWSRQDKGDFAAAFRARMEAVLEALVPEGSADRGGVFPACYSHGNTLSSKFSWQQVGGRAGGTVVLERALASWLYKDSSVPRRTVDVSFGPLGNSFCSQQFPVKSVSVTVNSAGLPLNTVDDHFMGVNIDTGSLYRWLNFTRDADFARLSALLAPAQLRIGGGAADAMLFSRDGPEGAGPNIFPTGLNGQITNVNARYWREITSFAASTGLSLLFDVNGFAFREGVTWGAWNASGNVPWPQNKACPNCTRDAPFIVDNSNLTALLDLAETEGSCVDAISVGNEPDLWYRYGLTLSGAQSARDLRAVKARLASRYPGLSAVKLAGPSWASFSSADSTGFFQGMYGAGPYLATTHDYPIPNTQQSSGSNGCDVPTYSDLGRFADPSRGLSANVRGYVSALEASGAAVPVDASVLGSAVPRDVASPRMVLEETATSALGGCANYSDRFISGFFVVNALTEPFEAGYQQVNYQDLVGWRQVCFPFAHRTRNPSHILPYFPTALLRGPLSTLFSASQAGWARRQTRPSAPA